MAAKPIEWLPLPETNGSVKLQLLDGGSFIANYAVLHAGVKDESFRMYNWAFHIFHHATNRHILWDLGLTSNPNDYTPWVNKFLIDVLKPVSPKLSISEQLKQRGVNVEEVDSVIFSSCGHAHWDHSRPIREFFPNATGYFGPGTTDFCSPGHLVDSNCQWDGRFFDPENKTETWEELNGPWEKFGPFTKALDYFGDGSFWIIQAPGHMPGNLCAVVKLEDGEWVLLGSDCCHSRELFDGVHEIAVWKQPDGSTSSLQADLCAAKDTIARIRIMEQDLKVHIAFAHDISWIKEGSDKVLMSLVDGDIIDSVRKVYLEDDAL